MIGGGGVCVWCTLDTPREAAILVFKDACEIQELAVDQEWTATMRTSTCVYGQWRVEKYFEIRNSHKLPQDYYASLAGVKAFVISCSFTAGFL